MDECQPSILRRIIASTTAAIITSIVGLVSFLMPIVTPLDVVKVRLQLQHRPTSSSLKVSPLSQLNLCFPSILPQTSYHAVSKSLGASGGTLLFDLFVAIAVSLVSPLELVRTRTQALSISNFRSLKETIYSLSVEINKKGIGTLWRGLIPTLWRDVPFSSIYWLGYEALKAKTAKDFFPNSELKASFMSGFCSGAFAAFLTTPFDVAKTRRQVLERRASSLTAIFREIYHHEGVLGLFKEHDTAEFNGDEAMEFSFKKILVIYTGGTIGMKWTKNKGYIPSPGYFYSELSNLSIANDQKFLRWICSSHRGYESPSDKLYLGPEHHVFPEKTTLSPWLVLPSPYESREETIFSSSVSASSDDDAILEQRVIYKILEHVPLLDSSNMNMDDWFSIACDIETYYPYFDSFVVLHGTDTMAYTASALSFLLENLGKTVIPLAEPRNDALHNFIGSMTIASKYCIPEVTILFGNKLFRGNRVTKFNAMDFNAFSSHNMTPLAELGVDILIKPSSMSKFNVQKNINPNVSILRLFPGIPTPVVESFLKPPIRGVVLETFGTGNAPTNRPELLRLFKEAAERDVVIINISQCGKGIVQNELYETGRFLSSFGIVPGGDMTVECAITKLAYLLGKESPHLSMSKIRQLLGTSLCGELTMPITRPIYSVHDHQQTHTILGDEEHLLKLCVKATNEDSESIIVPAVFERLVSQGAVKVLQNIQQEFPILFSRWILLPIGGEKSTKTLLHLAASLGNPETVCFLLQNGLSVHTLDDEFRTPVRMVSFLTLSSWHLLLQRGISKHLS
ncbi:L-asparaginase [Mitosporidium daphniae]|uniref:asparaginase n=1 Tax=Mitosporidium daphniae TaxID=1485682 RepID=A0A098VNR5_9MICR|nr:L-asparaginase [Mitosporidium daphniae]KGG50409.1 L-asparaginase [Mitosporidium daphniae]|eukprot:XP_013236847.1 L-asparaginase [Mitosporidium daphniae]